MSKRTAKPSHTALLTALIPKPELQADQCGRHRSLAPIFTHFHPWQWWHKPHSPSKPGQQLQRGYDLRFRARFPTSLLLPYHTQSPHQTMGSWCCQCQPASQAAAAAPKLSPWDLTSCSGNRAHIRASSGSGPSFSKLRAGQPPDIQETICYKTLPPPTSLHNRQQRSGHTSGN